MSHHRPAAWDRVLDVPRVLHDPGGPDQPRLQRPQHPALLPSRRQGADQFGQPRPRARAGGRGAQGEDGHGLRRGRRALHPHHRSRRCSGGCGRSTGSPIGRVSRRWSRATPGSEYAWTGPPPRRKNVEGTLEAYAHARAAQPDMPPDGLSLAPRAGAAHAGGAARPLPPRSQCRRHPPASSRTTTLCPPSTASRARCCFRRITRASASAV